jgi:hypothetical protein
MGINWVDLKKLAAENLKKHWVFLKVLHTGTGFSAKLEGRFEMHVYVTRDRIGFRVATAKEQFSLFHAILPRCGDRGWVRAPERVPGIPVYERCVRVTPESLASYRDSSRISFMVPKIPNVDRKTKGLRGSPLENRKLISWLQRRKCRAYFESELIMDDADWADETLLAEIVDCILSEIIDSIRNFNAERETAALIRAEIESISGHAREFLSKNEDSAQKQLSVLQLIGGSLARSLEAYLNGQGSLFSSKDYQSHEPEGGMPENFRELLFDGIDHADFNKWKEAYGAGREMEVLFTVLAGIYAAIFSCGIPGKRFREHADFWIRQSFRQNAGYLEALAAEKHEVPDSWKEEFKENYHLVLEGVEHFSAEWRGLPKHSIAVLGSYGLLRAIQSYHSNSTKDKTIPELAGNYIRSYVRLAMVRQV